MIYTGIGARAAPKTILDEIEKVSNILARLNFTLRSGGALGCDQAFERKANKKEIYIPFNNFLGKYNHNNINIFDATKLDNYNLAIEITRACHPIFDKLSDTVKQFHIRNCYQVLGLNLNEPSDLLICWTEDGSEKKTTNKTGGSGQAIRLANKFNIPVINIANNGWQERLKQVINNIYVISRV